MSPPLGRALDRLYAEWPFDVLHAHCLAPAGHAAARWVAGGRRRRGPRSWSPAHGPDMIHVPETAGRPAGMRAALGTADLVMANSTWARGAARRSRAVRCRREVVHLGADVPSSGRLRTRPCERRGSGSSPSRTWSLASATSVVLRAMALMPSERRPEYLVIGDGPCREPLERLAAELGVADRVRFAGQLPNPEAVRARPQRATCS